MGPGWSGRQVLSGRDLSPPAGSRAGQVTGAERAFDKKGVMGWQNRGRGGTFGQQRALADEFRLNLLDRRGYGKSPAAPAIGWPTDAGDVAGLLTELGGAHLVGHSPGGTVALLAAALAPHAVRSLVAVEPSVWGIADPGSSPPLDQVAVAHRAVAKGGVRGRYVLTP